MVFVDTICLSACLKLLPALVFWRIRQPGASLHVRYFGSSRFGRRMLKLLRCLNWVAWEEIDYSYIEVRYPDSSCVGPHVMSSDLTEICARVRADLFEKSASVAKLEGRFDGNRLLIYLEKCLAEQLATTLMQIHVVSWYLRTGRIGLAAGSPVFLIKKAPWVEQLKEYAMAKSVALTSYATPPTLPNVNLRTVVNFAALLGNRLSRKQAAPERKPAGEPAANGVRPGVAISYQGKGVELDLSKNTDVFWVPFAPLSREQFVVYFSWSEDPLNDEKLTILRETGMRGVAMNNVSRGSAAAPIWNKRICVYPLLKDFRTIVTSFVLAMLGKPRNFRCQLWLIANLARFIVECEKWRCFFIDFGIKIHVDYSDWSKERLPADEAIAKLGGISISYQRADESYSTLLRARAVDVHFAYSPALADSEQKSHSDINDFVAAGYTLDYAFHGARQRAQDLRRYLLDRGSRFIVAFFDENSMDDKRVCPSHEYRAENYRFLLDRLLKEPELGLIFKPKKPKTLRARLGPVAQMLDEALATGRCFLFEEGIVATTALPCEASQAADLAIGLLFGASAALESALAGTRTLLLDREGLLFHPLYRLGEGKVVFRDWDNLWQVLCAYRNDPAVVPGFGDWSHILDVLDPFRDGRAAERIGQYIGWLGEGLSHGSSRESTLEMARNRYIETWGADKVASIR